jgi:hypothetical protein
METATESEKPAILANTPPAPGEYWPGQGGHYIFTALPSHGLPLRALIASAAEAESLTYGPYMDVPDSTNPIDGRSNTAALLSTGKDHPAAAWAAEYTADGHTDFYLPSQHDLLLARWHAPQLFNKDDWYWSSTQTSRTIAFLQDFENGNSVWLTKVYEPRVRAFRWVQLESLNT